MLGLVGQREALEDAADVRLDGAGREVQASAIAVLDRPSAMRASTSRSRALSWASSSRRPRPPTSSGTTSGSNAQPSAATRRTASRKSGPVTRSLSR
ncbi:hypothetical protein BJF78_11925 [Pseudonocardia sp. CNS-139]|nr:hypothetical protein BJF78_11925 [Pseudonocardia sp. CNS-139]